jgi:hypothetical protein
MRDLERLVNSSAHALQMPSTAGIMAMVVLIVVIGFVETARARGFLAECTPEEEKRGT